MISFSSPDSSPRATPAAPPSATPAGPPSAAPAAPPSAAPAASPSGATPWQRLVAALGLKRNIVGLLAMVILVGTGERLAERFLPLYLVVLGGGAYVVGLLNGLDNLLSALYSLPGGWLAERLGTKRSLLLFNLIAMAGFVIVIGVPTWPAVIGASFLFLSWTAISLPATMGLVAATLPKTQRTMGVSLHSLVRRVPMALGPVVGGLLIDHFGTRTGIRLAFTAALGMAALAAVLQQVLIADDAPRAARAAAGPRGWRVLRLLSPALRNLLIADILIRFCEQIPYAFVVLWCVQGISGAPGPVSAFQFGLLTTVEMVTAMLVYIPIALLADRGTKKPFVLITFGFFTIFPLTLLAAHSFWPLVGAFVVRGLKEFGEPTRKALILDLAPEDRKAMTFGVYYLVRDMIVAVAAFSGGFLWDVSPQTNLLVATACGLIGTVWFALRGRDVGPQRTRATETRP